MDTKKLLNKLGFSENEAVIYLSSLELGLSSAQEIAKKAEIKRTTTYSVLGYLVDKGFMSKTKIKGKTRFLVEPPEKLLELVNDIQSELSNQLPELKAIYNANPIKPKITFYEGKQAIINVYDDTLNEKPDEILEWNTNRFFQDIPKEYNYINKRVKLGIKARRMAGSGSKWHKKNKHKDSEELAKTIIVPKEDLDPEIEVNIYNNKVAFMNYEDKMSIIIESKAIANAMKDIYELSWKGAKSVEVK